MNEHTVEEGIEKTGEERTVETAHELAAQLLGKAPLLKGVAITFLWDLPEEAAAAMTHGIVKTTTEGVITLPQLADITKQLASMQHDITTQWAVPLCRRIAKRGEELSKAENRDTPVPTGEKSGEDPDKG